MLSVLDHYEFSSLKKRQHHFLCSLSHVDKLKLSRFFFFFKKNIYLLIYLVALGLSCGSWAPQLWHVNSQLRHACGIQFPGQGSNPGPLHWEHRVLTTVPPGKSLSRLFFRKVYPMETKENAFTFCANSGRVISYFD